ncbi:MAG: alpha/beta fold hydrolase [Anaerolineales bacterium]|jgi:carboxylesterase
MMLLEQRARPFFFPGGRSGCVLIHGFPGAPEEMRWLGEYLAQEGITALGVRLFGHGTQPADLIRARKEHWIANVEDGIALLKETCQDVFLVGLSLGGVLALNLSSHFRVSGVVAMAAPYALPPLVGRLRPILKPLSLFWRYREPPEDSYWHDKEAQALNLHYPVQPMRAIAEVYDLVDITRERLQLVTSPVLLIYSRNDDSVSPDNAERIFSRLVSQEKILEWVENSGHNIPRDAERKRVFERIASFVDKWTVNPS